MSACAARGTLLAVNARWSGSASYEIVLSICGSKVTMACSQDEASAAMSRLGDQLDVLVDFVHGTPPMDGDRTRGEVVDDPRPR